MNYNFQYKVEDYTNEDLMILQRSFIPNIKANSCKGKNTLDSVVYISLNPSNQNLVIDIEVMSNSDEILLKKSIHGGLGKALGKDRVKSRYDKI